MEDRLASQEARITALEASWEERVKAFAWWEDRMAAWEARVKTLERNNPLETRLRAVEALQATAVAKSYGASSWTIMPFAWLQFAFRWVGKFHQGIQVAVAQTISNRQPVPTNQRPLSTNLKQQPARVDSSASQSMAATSTLQVHPERELQDTNQSNWHPTLSESSEKGIDKYATLLKDSSMQDTFFEQKGLEGYSQSLVLTPSTADKLKSNRAKTSLLHREACKRRLDTYIDPESGYEVFTAHHLRTRDCCGSGCRHCPWGHRNVPGRHKAQNSDITQKQGHLVRLESWELGLSIEKPTSKNVIPKSRLYTRKGDAGYRRPQLYRT